MTATRIPMIALLMLAGCGSEETNAPTDPARPIDTPEAAAPTVAPPPGVGSVMPGSGPQTVVGKVAGAGKVALIYGGAGRDRKVHALPPRVALLPQQGARFVEQGHLSNLLLKVIVGDAPGEYGQR